MLRIHFLQQWFNRSGPTMEEALYDTPGIARNDNKRQVMFALANPWMVRRTLPTLQA